jgi:hypothetical protein
VAGLPGTVASAPAPQTIRAPGAWRAPRSLKRSPERPKPSAGTCSEGLGDGPCGTTAVRR